MKDKQPPRWNLTAHGFMRVPKGDWVKWRDIETLFQNGPDLKEESPEPKPEPVEEKPKKKRGRPKKKIDFELDAFGQPKEPENDPED